MIRKKNDSKDIYDNIVTVNVSFDTIFSKAKKRQLLEP